MSHVRFPPPDGSLLLPISSRSAFRSSLTLWSTCRPKARAVRAALYWGVGLTGTLALRTLRPESLSTPVSGGVWRELKVLWRTWFGPFDEVAMYRPRQSERTGFVVLLLRSGSAVGFVKVRPGWDFRDEAATVGSVAGACNFSTPPVTGVEVVRDWGVIGFSPLPPGLHSPRLREEAASLTDEISGILVPPNRGQRPVPEDWRPMHGDLGPWNLRWQRGVGPVIFDWEEAAFGPPAADLVFHAAACRAMGIGGREVRLEDHEEAVGFWLATIGERFGETAADQMLAEQMLEVLNRL